MNVEHPLTKNQLETIECCMLRLKTEDLTWDFYKGKEYIEGNDPLCSMYSKSSDTDVMVKEFKSDYKKTKNKHDYEHL